MKVRGKRIIVTGAGGGIGRELVLQLLSKGAYVAAIDINEQELQKTKEKANNDSNLSLYVVDITNDDSINGFKENYLKEHSSIDGIINNAGIIQPFVSADKLEMDIINRVMNVNFFGPLKLIKLFMPELSKSPEAHITNVSSMGGFFPFPGQTVYGASKAALKLFTEGLYAELLDSNIHVTIVFPGAVATDIAKNSAATIKNDTTNSNFKMLSSQKAASLIIEAIEKNKFQAYVGTDSKLMHFMYKINPKGAIKFINKKMREMI